MANWNVRAWGEERYFTCEANDREEALDRFLESDPEFIGVFIEAFPDGTPIEDRTVSLSVQDLVKRHMIKNRDAVKVLNDMGLDAIPDDNSYKMFKDNARWFKEKAL